jgi:tetratricopeptide (TPR) repeat protein
MQQNQQQAINELIDLDKTQRNQTQTRLLLAELYEKNGKRRLGIQKLEETLKKNPGSREVRLTLVRMYRSERPPNFKEALDKVTEAENDPVLKTDPVWHREAAILYQDQRRVIDAIAKMREALRLAPGNNDYRRQFVDMLIRFNQFPAALIETDRLLRDGIDNWWLRSQRGVAIGRQVNPRMIEDARKDPKTASQVKDIQTQALSEFDKALSMVSQDTERTMIVLRSMGETVGYDSALGRLAPHLTNDPNNDWKILALGMKRAKGDFAGAIADGERMLADPANSPQQKDRRVPILRALADVYQNKVPPDYAKARQRYEELLQYTPDDLVSLNNLAYILAELSTPAEPQEAKKWSKKAFDITLASNAPEASIQDTHGWVLTLCGGNDLRQGMLILRAVVENKPDLAEAHYHLAEAYNRLARPQDAEKEFAETVRLLSEDENLGLTVDTKLREKAQTGLGRVREALKMKPAA